MEQFISLAAVFVFMAMSAASSFALLIGDAASSYHSPWLCLRGYVRGFHIFADKFVLVGVSIFIAPVGAVRLHLVRCDALNTTTTYASTSRSMCRIQHNNLGKKESLRHSLQPSSDTGTLPFVTSS